MLLIAACGGHGGPGFAAQADAICREQNRALRALPPAPNLVQARANYDKRVAVMRQEQHELGTLDPPEGLDASLRGLIAAIDDELAAAEDLRVASLSSDIESAKGAAYRGSKAARRALTQARRLGLAVCGRPPTTP